MVCSGKSIGRKSAAFRSVALRMPLTPKLNCIISAPQRQLLPLPHLPIYPIVYFCLKCPKSCHHMKTSFLHPLMAATLAQHCIVLNLDYFQDLLPLPPSVPGTLGIQSSEESASFVSHYSIALLPCQSARSHYPCLKLKTSSQTSL